jgi:hypothetical protein
LRIENQQPEPLVVEKEEADPVPMPAFVPGSAVEVEKELAVEHGDVGGAGTPPAVGDWEVVGDVIGATKVVGGGAGLKPRLLISVEPSGRPAFPIGDVDGIVVDALLPAAVAQEVDVAPAMPPPSNVPVVDGDADPPAVEQAGAGLMPGTAISVAPSGMPVGAADVAPEPMARGDALRTGDAPPTWANAQPQASRIEAGAATARNFFFMARSPRRLESRAPRDGRPWVSRRLPCGRPR